MKLNITGRHLDVPAPLQEHINKKILRLKKYFDGIIDVHVILSNEKHHYISEITLQGSGFTVHGEEDAEDLRTSFDKAVSKIEAQIRKYKDRLSRPRRSDTKPTEATAEEAWKLDILDSADLEREEPERRVIRSKQFAVKPMSLDEAVMQMDLIDQDFLVYRDSDSQRVHVLYRRRDGNFGLIEPQF